MQYEFAILRTRWKESLCKSEGSRGDLTTEGVEGNE